MERGSRWRKWDLHVHTPESFQHEFHFESTDEAEKYGGDIWEKYITELENIEGISVLGITDYFTIAGYKKILEYKKNDRLPNIDLILPNIEFRLDTLVAGRTDRRLNYHVIFSDSVPPATIEREFLTQINIKTTHGEDRILSVQNITDIGRSLKEQHDEFKSHSDLYIGCMNITVSLDKIIEALERKKSIFQGNYLLVVPDEGWAELDWNRQDHLTRKACVNRSHAIFSSNKNTIEWALGKKEKTLRKFIEEFCTVRPCIHGSDSHSFKNLCKPDENRFCWIKGDPTFKGLKQILNEPEDRVYIGELPPSLERVRLNRTKYIDSLRIGKAEGAIFYEKWFDCNIKFNSGLVAIIGNKGSGKSALADTLGLLGNTLQEPHFSFLNPKKFRQSKNNKAKYFDAVITWKNGRANKKNLDDGVEEEEVETIKYIPQNHLELICNELQETKKSSFDQELKGVIFSHVGDAETLGQHTLDELIAYKTKETYVEIDLLKSELGAINQKIVSYENQLTEKNRKSIENQFQLKKEELASHDKVKPVEVTKPETDVDKQKEISAISKEIEAKQKEIESLESEIADLKTKQKREVGRIAAAENLLSKIDNFEKQYQAFMGESEKYLKELGLGLHEIFDIKLNRKPVIKAQEQATKEREKIKDLLDPEKRESPAFKKNDIVGQIEKLQERLDEPNKQYQAYLSSLNKWSSDRLKIIGDDTKTGTINYLKKKIEEFEKTPQRLDDALRDRIAKSKEIYSAIKKLADVYMSLYSPVQKFIETHPLAKDKFNLQFNVSIVNREFEKLFFEYISHGVKGSFCGVEEGSKILSSIQKKADYDSELGVVSFLDEIMGHLSEDKRQVSHTKSVLAEQLRKDVSVQSFYDYLFSLDYLSPRYSLKWSGRSIDELSPGERGTLLLVFYLLIDNNDIPLIIDQPEENLDNQTVYDILVPCIKEAKARRQIVIVTHNPNLAVVCDADQIIYSSIDKQDCNKVDYETGSIENPEINKHIVDILEGTMPAFDNRDRKYHTVI